VGERDTVHPWPCRRGEGTPALPAGQLLGGEGSHGEGSRASPPVPAAAAPGAAGTCPSQLEGIAAAACQARRELGAAVACRAAVDMDIAWIIAGVDTDASQ